MRTELSDWSARLAALPGFEPPAAGWEAVVAARVAREARLSLRWPVALAAVALIAAAGLAGSLHAARSKLAAGPALAGIERTAIAAEMRAENRRLEAILAALPERNAMRGSTAYTLAELEDRLALVDDRLSRVTLEPNAPERAEALWRERVDVMHTLVQVRYADAVGAW